MPLTTQITRSTCDKKYIYMRIYINKFVILLTSGWSTLNTLLIKAFYVLWTVVYSIYEIIVIMSLLYRSLIFTVLCHLVFSLFLYTNGRGFKVVLVICVVFDRTVQHLIGGRDFIIVVHDIVIMKTYHPTTIIFLTLAWVCVVHYGLMHFFNFYKRMMESLVGESVLRYLGLKK